MADPVLVEKGQGSNVKPKELDALVGALRAEGLDARRVRPEWKGVGTTLREAAARVYFAFSIRFYIPLTTEVVIIWFAATTGAAVINQAVQIAAEWLRDRSRQDPEHGNRRKVVVQIGGYEGEEGWVYEIIELESGSSEPTRRAPTAFERYTRKKPAGG